MDCRCAALTSFQHFVDTSKCKICSSLSPNVKLSMLYRNKCEMSSQEFNELDVSPVILDCMCTIIIFKSVVFQVDWTPELHKKFVQAVEKLGVDQAVPSRILDLMKVQGLTRHNIASHLQVGGKWELCVYHCKARFFLLMS